MSNPEQEGKSRRDLDRQLDILEARIAELRVQYEQYFVDIIAQPPDKERKEVNRLIRSLLRAPFKNSASRFRLRTLVQRYQTYGTYWERVNKQREEGTYHRDVFKADMREKMVDEACQQNTKNAAANKGMEQLFNTYQTALKKTGGKTDNLSFDTFKKSLISKAKNLKNQTGVKKLQYKVVVKNGKVVVKASSK